MTRAPSLAAQRFTLSDLCLACAEDETAPDRHKSVGEALSESRGSHMQVEPNVEDAPWPHAATEDEVARDGASSSSSSSAPDYSER